MQSLYGLVVYLVGNGLAGVSSLLAVVVTFGALWAVGRLCSAREAPLATLAGWGLVYLVSILAAIAGLTNLKLTLGFLGLATVASFVVHGFPVRSSRSWPTLLLVVPLFAFATMLPSFYWDSYSHWLPNALYVVQTDRFLTGLFEGFPSTHPTYPPATSLIIYFASCLTGEFAENAGLLTNVTLSLIAIAYVNALLRRSLANVGLIYGEDWLTRMWFSCFAFAAIVLLNPSIQWVHYWSTLAEPVIAVVVLITICAWCEYLVTGGGRLDEQPAGRTSRPMGPAGDLAVLFTLGVLIGGIKHSGWQATVVMTCAIGMASMLRGIPARRWVVSALAICSGTAIAWAVWKYYLVTQLPLRDQFSIHPLSIWRWDLLTALLVAVVEDVKTFWIYYAMLVSALMAGIAALFRPVSRSSPIHLMLAVASLGMLGHFASLMAAYLGTGFEEWEIRRAASLQRYTTQFGFSVIAIGFVALATKVLPMLHRVLSAPKLRRRNAFVGFGALAVLYLGLCIYPTLSYARYFYEYQSKSRDPAARALAFIPDAGRVAIIGEEWSVLLARYASLDVGLRERPVIVSWDLAWARDHLPLAESRISEWMSDRTVDYILLLDAPDIAVALGLSSERDHLWDRAAGAWRAIDTGRLPATK